MSTSSNLHDVISIEIEPTVKVNGHSWQNVKIVMRPTVELPDGSWGKVTQRFSFAMHCADENRPIDIKLPS